MSTLRSTPTPLLDCQRSDTMPPSLQRRVGHAMVATWMAVSSMAACAQTSAPTPRTADPVKASEAVSDSVSNSGLDAPLFYQLLIGELHARTGDAGAAYSLILDAARNQRDPLLYRRAVDIALQARSGESALSAARAWSRDLPGSPDADRFVLQILLALNRVAETGPALTSLLASGDGVSRDETINAIPQTYARVSDKALALQVVQGTLNPYLQGPHAPAAWTTVGRMELAVEQPEAALTSARKGHAANPQSPFPAMLALELVERGQRGAEDIVRDHLRVASPAGPFGSQVPLAYARILLDLQRTAEAARQLESLTTNQPELADAWLLQATIQVQENKLDAASKSLQNHMRLAREAGDERSARGLTQAYLLMAQIAEKQNDIQAANAWLDRIENADDIMAAQMRRASLLARQGQMTEARALLRNHPERRPDDARLKLVAEAQLLRDFKQWQEAYLVYKEAVRQFPDQTDLLYDQAMMAEKADNLAEMEVLLRQLIAAKPDFHHAYNALGYSLADRNVRLPEAKELIEKAVALAPGDAYIQDSLGWVEFRMGNVPRALSILQAAYGKRPDAEIAAHLGEVHWVLGQREQALKIWREGLLLANDNETLLNTLKRFQVQP
ncbi:lipopolysaccharide assembly protein LapB [Hydrogenophaga sp.]|uniref:tetratricopeptide repeat protein n=1 Tax=Hydrogenophaga sp. TaxID=1904254 RepID=UPI002716505A|nr:tetratricopeptide repeat protein [Hydrogenophaga sp.]MDO8905382.1 tetratricopeptide repeat protein [Hydrogenophaga sp.]